MNGGVVVHFLRFCYNSSMNMSRKIAILIIVAFGLVELFLIRDVLTDKLTEIKKTADLALEEVKKDVSLPSPLRATSESEQAHLTRGGVTKWTNIHRANASLPALAENPQLNTAARLKVQDIFARQYFDFIVLFNLHLFNLIS